MPLLHRARCSIHYQYWLSHRIVASYCYHNAYFLAQSSDVAVSVVTVNAIDADIELALRYAIMSGIIMQIHEVHAVKFCATSGFPYGNVATS